MVYRRRTYRRRTYRKKRSFQKRRGSRRIFRRRSTRKVMMYKRTAATVSVLCTDTVNAGSKEFALSDMPSYNDFTALYDQYKLNMCVVKIRWQYNGPTGEQPPTVATQCAPNFHWVIDHDDSTPVTTLATMGQYDTHRMVAMKGQSITIKVRPTFLRPTWLSAVASGYGPTRGWLSTSSYGVPHYGLKWILDASLNGGAGTYNLGHLWMDYTYYFSMRSVK